MYYASPLALTVWGVIIGVTFLLMCARVYSNIRVLRAYRRERIEKPFNDQDLSNKIYNAVELDAQIRREQASIAEIAARVASLTSREQEIMRMIVDGKPSKVIAIELNISEKTVQTHRTRIMKKMGAESLAALIKMALKEGMTRAAPSGNT